MGYRLWEDYGSWGQNSGIPSRWKLWQVIGYRRLSKVPLYSVVGVQVLSRESVWDRSLRSSQERSFPGLTLSTGEIPQHPFRFIFVIIFYRYKPANLVFTMTAAVASSQMYRTENHKETRLVAFNPGCSSNHPRPFLTEVNVLFWLFFDSLLILYSSSLDYNVYSKRIGRGDWEPRDSSTYYSTIQGAWSWEHTSSA